MKSVSFDYDSATAVLWNFEDAPARRFYIKTMKRNNLIMLEELFYNAPFPFLFHSTLIENLNKNSPKIPLSKEELVGYQIIYFCEYVLAKGIDTTAIHLMWTCRHPGPYTHPDGAVENYLLFTKEIKFHIKRFLITNDLREFLKGSIKKNHVANIYTIYPAFLDSGYN